MEYLEDFYFLNSEVLLLASDRQRGKHFLKLLGAHPRVAHLILTAGKNSILTALRCREPLVTFAPELDELINLSEAELRATSPQQVPEELRRLTSTALHVAHRLAVADPLSAQTHFQFTPRQCERFMQIGIGRLTRLRDRRGVLLRLRAADKVFTWERILIGDRLPDARGFRIAQRAAMASLG